MRRRTVLVGGGSLIAASGAVLGSGAFSSSSAFGGVDVTVTGEAVAAYPSHDDAENDQNRTGDPTVSGDLQENRVNVQTDAFGLRHTANDGRSYQVSVTMIDSSGDDLDDLEGYLGDDIRDFRLLTTAEGDSERTFVDTDPNQDMRDTLEGNDGTPGDLEYLDQNNDARRTVPDVGEAESRSAVTLSTGGATLQVAAVVSVADNAESTRLPDFRVDVEQVEN